MSNELTFFSETDVYSSAAINSDGSRKVSWKFRVLNTGAAVLTFKKAPLFISKTIQRSTCVISEGVSVVVVCVCVSCQVV